MWNRKSDEQDQRVQRVYITELGRETSEKDGGTSYKNAVKEILSKGVSEEELDGLPGQFWKR